MRHLSKSAGAVIGLAVVLLVLVVLTRADEPLSPRSASGGDDWPTLTPTRVYPDAIQGAATAIARSQVRLSNHDLNSETARLISYATFLSWAGMSDSHRPATLPVWLVGVLGDDLTMADVMPYSGSTEPVGGGFHLWDATSGDLMANGRLYDTGDRTHASIVALPTESLAISTATAMPVFEPGTAEPSATYSLNDIATANAVLTAIAEATPTPTRTPPVP